MYDAALDVEPFLDDIERRLSDDAPGPDEEIEDEADAEPDSAVGLLASDRIR